LPKGRGGYYFHNVEVTVPPNVAIGRYALQMFDGGHNPVTGTPVPFNVIFNPYRLVGAGFSKQQLETFAYDEEEDGEDWGADADSGRDDWTAYHRWETHVRAYQLHAFARRENAAPGKARGDERRVLLGRLPRLVRGLLAGVASTQARRNDHGWRKHPERP